MVGVKRKKPRAGPDVAPGYDKEPVFPGEISEMDLIRALNWYAYFWEEKKSAKALIEHFKAKGEKKTVSAIRAADARLILPTYCHLARLMDNGSKLSQRDMNRFEDHVKMLVRSGEKAKKEKAEEEKDETSAPKITVQDRIQEQADAVAADIDYMIDAFIKSGYQDQKFKCYQWLDRQDIKPVHARKIADIYQPMIDELKEALAGDKELSEAYDKMKKTDLKRLIKMLEDIVTDCETWATNKTKTRVPKKRKPKERPIAKQVEKLKFKSEDRDLKIASVAPEKIVGAEQVWLFNVKYRKLTRLDALTREGFTVKGTTIQGIDVENSVSKSVRKPNETIPRVLEGGKRVLGKVMDELTTKAAEAKGRVNEDTIILRVV